MLIFFLILLSLVQDIPGGSVVVLLLLFLPTLVFGILAIVSARRELKETPMVPENISVRRRMKIGMALGVLSILIFTPFLVLTLSLFKGGGVGSHEEAVKDDMADLAHHVYQYRIRPSTMGGGEGSYLGYSIPDNLRSNENGSYREIVSADTVIFIATSVRNPQETFRGTIDAQEKLSFSESGD